MKLPLSQGLKHLFSMIFLEDFFQVSTNYASSSSSSRIKDPNKTLKVPSTVFVLPVPGGPWINVIPCCLRLSWMALYCESLKVFLSIESRASGIPNFFYISLLCRSGLRSNSLSKGLTLSKLLKARKILSKVVMVVTACMYHFLLELTISKFYFEKQCSYRNTLTWIFGSWDPSTIPTKWG